MPTRHNWEVKINDEFLPAKDKKQVMELARSAMKTGVSVEIFENGEKSNLNDKLSGKVEDTFSHEMRLELHRLQFHTSSLAQEFENDMSDTDLAEELASLYQKFQALYDKVNTRIEASREQYSVLSEA